ncbi:MAG: hypothetical protein ACD_86C00001G0003 [uncultured bacterium]|nr:MAG: hypothetical protein ACD_86C00001G0003 [uncultured bacterium]
MSISDIFPSPVLSKTEEDLLIEAFSNPLVQKYLRNLAMEDTKELLGLSAIAIPASELINAHAVVQGKLSVIATLLSIPPTNPIKE